MRPILLNSVAAALVGLVVFGNACAAPANPTAELVEMQDRLLRAVLEGRRDEYAAMLHDDWRVTHVDGRVRTKAQVLADVFGAESPVVSGSVEGIDVRVYGDAAVVTGRSSWASRTGESLELRFTDTVVRRDGRWLIVASHATALEH